MKLAGIDESIRLYNIEIPETTSLVSDSFHEPEEAADHPLTGDTTTIPHVEGETLETALGQDLPLTGDTATPYIEGNI